VCAYDIDAALALHIPDENDKKPRAGSTGSQIAVAGSPQSSYDVMVNFSF
jgi:hypothetical protein